MNVIYVIGRGHSGTTALDITLGQALGLRSTGELISGLSRIESETCTCGEPLLSCNEWKKPIEQSFSTKREFVEYCRDISSLARIKRIFFFPFILLSKNIRALLSKERDFLYCMAEGKNGVIDSSKELTRGMFLSFGPSKAVWVHIVRNPVDVILSARARVDRGTPIKINRRKFHVNNNMLLILDAALSLIWTFWTIATVMIGKIFMRDRYLCVTYETFVTNPAFVSERVARMVSLEIPTDSISDRIADEITVGHILGGNRMAREKKFKLMVMPRKKVPIMTRILVGIISVHVYWVVRRFFSCHE